MKKATAKQETEMLKEYDFSKGVRGKYAERFKAGTNLVLLAPDVVKVFPDSDSVNEALRTLIKLTAKIGPNGGKARGRQNDL